MVFPCVLYVSVVHLNVMASGGSSMDHWRGPLGRNLILALKRKAEPC